MLELTIYKSLYEYVREGDWTHLSKSTLKDKGAAIDEVDLIDQPDQIQILEGNKEIEFDGKEYVAVNAGEEWLSYVPRESLGDTVWFVYVYGQVVSPPYKSKKEAQEAKEYWWGNSEKCKCGAKIQDEKELCLACRNELGGNVRGELGYDN